MLWFKQTIISDLVSNKNFKRFCTRKFINEKELEYISYDFLKKQVVLVNYIYYLKFISSSTMHLENPQYPTVELLQRTPSELPDSK